jgi:hypothetical protein
MYRHFNGCITVGLALPFWHVTTEGATLLSTISYLKLCSAYSNGHGIKSQLTSGFELAVTFLIVSDTS